MTSFLVRAQRALLVLAVVALAGCSVTRPAPVKQTFLLDPPAPAPAATAKSQPSSVRVGTVNIAAPFRGRSFVSREGELRYETDFYNEFLVPPATMIGELTSRALERAKVFARVAPINSAAHTDWLLDGFVSSVVVDAREQGKMYADVAISYYLFNADSGSGMPVWTKDYQQRVPLTATTPQAYAAGLNTALAQIFADLVRDLAAAELPKT
jgi:cholesterol transport system auxiliary component